MNIQLNPASLFGTIAPPTSKSAAHRALLGAALASGQSSLQNITDSQDIAATKQAVQALEAQLTQIDDTLYLSGSKTPPDCAVFDCHESGSTLRFLIPIAAALGIKSKFIGEGRLPQRPLEPLLQVMEEHGICFDTKKLPLCFSGTLRGGNYHLPGNISSQFITGLLFALPLCKEDSTLELTTKLESKGYIDLTIQVLSQFQIVIETLQNGYRIPGNQHYHPCDLTLEADYSNAAFWLCAAALNGSITVKGLESCSVQGDREILTILQQMGANLIQTCDGITISKSNLHGITIDAANIPDLVPILAVTAALANGTTVIRNTGRLRMKECDRLTAIMDGLTRLGAEIVLTETDDLVIHGKEMLIGGTVSSYGDHRIAMAMAIAANRCTQPVIIEQAQAVQKSYPRFFTDYQTLGGICHVL